MRRPIGWANLCSERKRVVILPAQPKRGTRILVLLAAAGIYLYRNHQRLENFPDQELVWMQPDTKGAEFALPQIEGYTRDDLSKKWGDPDHSAEEPKSDSWQITDDASIVISILPMMLRKILNCKNKQPTI